MNLLNPGIPVNRLCDEYLLREKQAVDAIYDLLVTGSTHRRATTHIPVTGDAHYRFFLDKLVYVEERQQEVLAELSTRGINPGTSFNCYDWQHYKRFYKHWRPAPHQVRRSIRRYFSGIMASVTVYYAGEQLSTLLYFNLIYSKLTNYANQKTNGSHQGYHSKNATVWSARNQKNIIRLHRQQNTITGYGRGYSEIAS